MITLFVEKKAFSYKCFFNICLEPVFRIGKALERSQG